MRRRVIQVKTTVIIYKLSLLNDIIFEGGVLQQAFVEMVRYKLEPRMDDYGK